MAQLGKAFTIIARQQVLESILHADVDAFGAPSECHGLVRKGELRREREAWRHAKAVSGLNRRNFRKAMKSLDRRTFERLFDVLNCKLNPYC